MSGLSTEDFSAKDFKERLLKALALHLGHFDRPTPGMIQETATTAAWNSSERKKNSTPAAVLVLLGKRQGGSEFEFLLTRRTETVEKHKGQMAFPGGAAEPGETSEQTALRETFEEVGIDPNCVDVLGELPGLWTPTGFWITPIVGLLTSSIEEAVLSYSQAEIADALWIPFSILLHPETYSQELIERAGMRYVTHVFTVPRPQARTTSTLIQSQAGGNKDRVSWDGTPYRIWGATGAIIKNLLDRLAAFK